MKLIMPLGADRIAIVTSVALGATFTLVSASSARTAGQGRHAAKNPVAVYRAYDGAALPLDSVSRLYAPRDTWIRAFDGRALADIRVGVYFELPAGRHSLRLRYEAQPSSSPRLIFVSAEPLEFDFEAGRAYRVHWEKQDGIWVPSIARHPESPPTAPSEAAGPCWYDVFQGQVEAFVWGKTMRERMKNPPRLTLRVDEENELRTWNFSSSAVLVRPESKMQELAASWSADGTFRGYAIGFKPLVPGRRVRALVSTCRPDEIREVLLD